MPKQTTQSLATALRHTLPRDRLRPLIRLYERLLVLCGALLPVVPIVLLVKYPWPVQAWSAPGFHEIAIGVSIALAAFVSAVTLRCYRDSGEPLLYWLTVAMLRMRCANCETPTANWHAWRRPIP
ncbi:hypothetical protein PTE30175_01872 [Pandoraea terrae]|uniref:Uncharacterized protein n=1 Tax=Pandoraea terrae TaxID=1537710 RepID=A0A5E4UEP9_9BURK|nr:hypothetical protein [Pandoraea terrae]VVD97334.1 hypothetical protein PTE30175_01872 [Pandoraea terrae]